MKKCIETQQILFSLILIWVIKQTNEKGGYGFPIQTRIQLIMKLIPIYILDNFKDIIKYVNQMVRFLVFQNKITKLLDFWLIVKVQKSTKAIHF